MIEAIVEINSVAGTTGYWAHVDDANVSQELLRNLQQLNTTPDSGIRSADEDQVQRKLPPSSAMSFLAQKRDIQATVITDYQKDMGRCVNDTEKETKGSLLTYILVLGSTTAT